MTGTSEKTKAASQAENTKSSVASSPGHSSTAATIKDVNTPLSSNQSTESNHHIGTHTATEIEAETTRSARRLSNTIAATINMKKNDSREVVARQFSDVL
jgi:hypothetical protein